MRNNCYKIDESEKGHEMNSIGERIEKKCKELNISIPELANIAGVNYKTLKRNMTAEDPNPTLQHLKRLCIALGMSIDNLAFGEEGSTDEEIAIILNDLKNIEKEDKKRILYMVRMMIAESKNRK
ncbi:helix-turn-helix domain-containing protein [Acinetobacter baumannii]|uniref:helix-turn-helix domain-containing protein n=1 Tax=Acinetobacter baumannii TaxID=470 RepID=UPI0004468470|nr:helix-turn-helix domain-containing protein [Acinetobacter baumannii]EXC39737.1 helix-turn-helix family protein [Acinetobacter baumannii 17534]